MPFDNEDNAAVEAIANDIKESLAGLKAFKADLDALKASGALDATKHAERVEHVKGLEERIRKMELRANRGELLGDMGGRDQKSVGAQVVESAQFKRMVEEGRGSGKIAIKGAIAQLQQKALTGSNAQSMVPEYRDPDVANLVRRRRVRLIELVMWITVESDRVKVVRKSKLHEIKGFLNAAASATDTTITVKNDTGDLGSVTGAGWKPGSTITLSEGLAAEETAVIDSLDVDTGVLTLTAGLTNNHLINASVTSDEFIFTAETKLRPRMHIEWSDEDYNIKTLSVTLRLSKQVLDDATRLESEINADAPAALERMIERQMLYGDNTSSQLQGILTDSGVLTYSWSAGVAGDTRQDAVRRSITLAYLADQEPEAIVLNPQDLEHFELNKASDGHYTMKGIMISPTGEIMVWRLPVVESKAINAGTWLVGNFSGGMRGYLRQGSTVEFFDQNRDDVERGMITVRAEQRLTVAVKEPEAFVVGTFDSAPA